MQSLRLRPHCSAPNRVAPGRASQGVPLPVRPAVHLRCYFFFLPVGAGGAVAVMSKSAFLVPPRGTRNVLKPFRQASGIGFSFSPTSADGPGGVAIVTI